MDNIRLSGSGGASVAVLTCRRQETKAQPLSLGPQGHYSRRTVTKYPNGVKNTTVYDNAGRITSITAINTSAGVLTKRDYTYTLNGTKDGSLRKTMTTNTGTVTTYGYDKLNRLTSAVAGGTTETWSYDWNGNRILETETGYSYGTAEFMCLITSAPRISRVRRHPKM